MQRRRGHAGFSSPRTFRPQDSLIAGRGFASVGLVAILGFLAAWISDGELAGRAKDEGSD
jgi:hypothetical protein